MVDIKEKPGLPISKDEVRFDGTHWRRFELPNRGTLWLTGRGQELLSFNPGLRRMLIGYKNEAKGNKEGDLRKWFKAGGNSDVYTLGNYPIVVKEASTSHSAWSALNRMDFLSGICNQFLPSYIRVPDHYGVFTSNNAKRQYLLIQKINDGLTVADLIRGDAPHVKKYLKDLAIREFEELESKIREAIEKSSLKHQIPKNLLPDWDPGNTLVDYDSPTKIMPFTFWIIDQ